MEISCTYARDPSFLLAVRLTGTLSGHPPPLVSWPIISQLQSSESSTPPGRTHCVTTTTTATTPDTAALSPKADSLPLLLPNTGLLGIPAGLVKKIRDGNCIDLGDLLPEALEWAFKRSTEDKSDKDKRKKFHISSVTDWVLAFATFMAVTVQFKPERAAALATYMTIVARLAREVPGQVWCRYDRLFRQAAAVNPSLPWDHQESDIWLAAMAENPRAGDLGSVTVPRTSARGEEVELCRRFNRGDCPFQHCRYRHACGICRARNHPARDCPLLQTPVPPAKRPPLGDRRPGQVLR